MFGFLANLRDIKSSLTAGTLMLFGFYLHLSRFVNDVPRDNSLWGDLWRLAEYLGTPATLGGIAFLAYLLGLVTSMDRLAARFLSIRSRSSLSMVSEERLNLHLAKEIKRANITHSMRELVEAVGYRPMNPTESAALAKGPTGQYLNPDSFGVDHWHRKILNRLKGSVLEDGDIHAVQLGSKRERAYERFDKARSEAEFRYSLMIPLLWVLTAFIMRLYAPDIFHSPSVGIVVGVIALMALSLVTIITLSARATQKVHEANEEIINAVILGEIVIEPIAKLQALKQPETLG